MGKDGQATSAFTFDEFATYERTVNDLKPGPRGDQDAMRLAETDWINSRSADEYDDQSDEYAAAEESDQTDFVLQPKRICHFHRGGTPTSATPENYTATTSTPQAHR